MRSAGRAIVLALLGCWIAPGAAALGAALHVELHHGPHADPPAAHATALAKRLAAAAEHGHSHEVTAPDHEHRALRGERIATLLAPTPAPAADAASVEPGAGERLGVPPPPERPPPRPLFTLHCSLLR